MRQVLLYLPCVHLVAASPVASCAVQTAVHHQWLRERLDWTHHACKDMNQLHWDRETSHMTHLNCCTVSLPLAHWNTISSRSRYALSRSLSNLWRAETSPTSLPPSMLSIYTDICLPQPPLAHCAIISHAHYSYSATPPYSHPWSSDVHLITACCCWECIKLLTRSICSMSLHGSRERIRGLVECCSHWV